MTTYTMNFSDPSTPVLVLNPYTVNGLKTPVLNQLESGASAARTTLLLYGKGAPSYGERIQENLLQMLEHFAGGTRPANPVAGQLWFDRRVFFHGSASYNANWFVWQDAPANPNGGSWVSISGGVIISGSGAPGVIVGPYTYYIDTAASPRALYQKVTETIHPAYGSWIKRGYMEDTAIPTPDPAIHKPQQQLMVQTYIRTSQTDEVNWIPVNGAWASPIKPVDPTDGTLWYDTANQSLKVYNASGSPAGFEAVVGSFLPLAGGTMSGYLVLNANPVSALGAATKQYVDAAVAGGAGSISFDNLTDVSLTVPSSGEYARFNGSLWVNSALSLADLGILSATVPEIEYLAGVGGNVQTQINSKLGLAGGTVSGSISMSGNRITSVGNPIATTDAVNKQYVDTNEKYTTAGSYDEASGTLTLFVSGSSNVTVTGFTPQYVALANELIGKLVAQPTTTEFAVHDLDAIVRRRTTFARKVATGYTGTTVPTPPYEVGSNKLMVFVDGVKFYGNTRGYQKAIFALAPGGSPVTPESLSCLIDPALPVGSPATVYNFRVAVDGGAPQIIAIDSSSFDANTLCTIVAAINSQLIGATATLEDTAIVIYSNTDGTGSTISIVDGDGLGSPDYKLFDSLPYFSAFATAVPGVTYGYSESGSGSPAASIGDIATSIKFTAARSGGQIIEVTVCGETGVPL